jgi:hypothetical protein
VQTEVRAQGRQCGEHAPFTDVASIHDLCPLNTKKTDVAEHPQVFRHVGLLTNEPLGKAGLLSI